MKHPGRASRSFLAALGAVLLFCGAAAGAQSREASDSRRAPSGAPRKPVPRDDNWPKKIPLGDATLSLDAPQAESLEGTKLTARGTGRFQRADGSEPIDGTVWYEAKVEIDRDRRTVTMVSVEVPRIDFPGVPPARQQRLSARLGQFFTRNQIKLPLDDVLAGARNAGRSEGAAPKLNTDPPKILFETEPAILVIFDGEPRFRAVEGTRLERALNTPFLVLRDPGADAYYLSGGTMWFRAERPTGPWSKTDKVPSEATQIASRDLKEGGIPQSELDEAKQTADKRVPKIIVATEPAELIVSDGAPVWAPLVAVELETADNSESDIFRTLPDRKYWIVLSGRWYTSDAYSGPWTYVPPDRLPQSFRRIPSDSPKADALAFVPGTAPAREAVADANKPRTAAVRRSEAHVDVTYDGEPRFEAISGTHVEYALNTPEQVLKIRGRYYVCDQGVWFVGNAATGPWSVADSVPEEEIQAIPPDSPVYNTRYVYVYDATPDVVYMAYTPAYLNSYPYYGAVVFGTGWAYRPWWGAYYYPRAWTWGFHPRFALWAGGWGYGFGWGPAWGGFRYGFGWGWGARWCGPGGFFRPAFRNVNITRNVSVTRNVNVTRNLYTSGANRTRAVAAQPAASRTPSAATGTAAARGARARPQGERSPQAGRAGKPNPGAARARPQKAHPGGHAGGRHGGGGKRH